MKKTQLGWTATVILMASLGVNRATIATVTAATVRPATLTLRSTEASKLLAGASYLKPTGLKMIKRSMLFSDDNGQTWWGLPWSPDFDSGLPYGYRRGTYAPFVDPVNGNIITAVISLDVPVDPGNPEPPIGAAAYYLRYRVSTNSGVTYLFDTPMVQVGKTQANPFDGVYTGTNGYYIGDGSGDRIIRTQSGRIIVPAQASVLDGNGDLWNPFNTASYTDAMLILGAWQPDSTIEWTSVRFIEGDPARSSRGMIEPTVVQMPDGRLLCVMRGSNGGSADPSYGLPGYRWYSVSSDDGDTWTAPQPWTYSSGAPFFSPSSCSHLLRHSNGRTFWIGNITPTNPQGNLPRYPLVIGEVHNQTLLLIESTVIELDTLQPGDPGVNLSHMWAIEDRVTHDIVVTGSRFSGDYTSNTPVTYRIGVHIYAVDEAVFGEVQTMTSASQLDLSPAGRIVYAIDCRGDTNRTATDRTVNGVVFQTDTNSTATDIEGYMRDPGLTWGYDNLASATFDIGSTTDDDRLEEIVRDVWYEPEAALDLRVIPGHKYKVTLIASHVAFDRTCLIALEGRTAVPYYLSDTPDANTMKLYTTGDASNGVTVVDGGLTIQLDPETASPNGWLNALIVEDLGADPDTDALNLAFGKPTIKASSEYTNQYTELLYAAQRAVDGSSFDPALYARSPRGEWLSAPGEGVDAYFIVDLQTLTVIEKTALINSSPTYTPTMGLGATDAFELWASRTVDGDNELVNGVRILQGTLSDVTGALIYPVDEFTSANGLTEITARYVKFVAKTVRGANGAAGLNDLQIYGSDPPRSTMLLVR